MVEAHKNAPLSGVRWMKDQELREHAAREAAAAEAQGLVLTLKLNVGAADALHYLLKLASTSPLYRSDKGLRLVIDTASGMLVTQCEYVRLRAVAELMKRRAAAQCACRRCRGRRLISRLKAKLSWLFAKTV